MQALSIRNLSSLKTQVKFPKTLTAATVAALATLAFVMLVSALPALAQVNGAIYTTTSTGTTVNGNLYDAKTGVYLNGGPQNSKDAGLVPDGSYYFQVTDPSGAVLLSADDVPCRQVVVSNGRIVSVPAKTQAACKSGFHLLGTYNASNGETPIQLCPPTSSPRTDNLNAGTYFDAQNWCDSTPNPGGEYKAWVTPVSSYNNCSKSNANIRFGFCDSDSKTDNFKVKGSNSAYITVCKYNDLDGDGTQGASEPLIPGWPISATGVDTLSGPLGTVNAQTDANGCISFSVSDFTTAKGKVTITEGSLTGSWHETAPVVGTYTVPDGIIPAHNGTVTVAVSNAGAPPNTQSLTVAAGENLTLTNFGNTCMDSSCGGNSVELTVTTDANPSLTHSYTWEIAKSVDNTTVNSVGGGKSSPANYTVTVTHDQGTDSGWQVTGTIKISNPSWVDLGGVDVADTVSNGGTCTVTNGSAITIPAKSEVDVPFSCTYSSLPGNGTDTAAVTWNSGSTTSGKATGTAAVNFGSPAVTVRDGGVTVADKLDNTTPVTLGTPSYSDPSPIKYTYFHTFTDPAGTCTSHTNNATFKTNTTGTTGSASATVQDCQVNPPSATCVVINAVLGVAITPVTMAASGGIGTGYTFSATGLPAGLTMASNGTITGTPTVSGTFSYTVTVKDSGGNTGTVTCSVTVNPASATIAWPAPTAITYGTTLSSAQLDAVAKCNGVQVTGGTYSYSPALGAVLSASQNQTLSVTFTPPAGSYCTFQPITTTLTVNPAVLTVTADSKTMPYGGPLPAFSDTITGFVNNDSQSVVSGSAAMSTTATTSSPVGNYPISISAGNLAAANYTFNFVNGTVTVNPASGAITWPVPTAITYGTTLSSAQLDASATCGGKTAAGSYVYSPAIGAVLGAGTQTLHVTFTPTDTTDCPVETATVTLVVNKATPSITWATPAAITAGTALSSTQLNATSTVPGIFTYSPAAGTVMQVGTQTLSVTLTPGDTTDYNPATATVQLVVNQAASSSNVTLSFSNTVWTYPGEANITACVLPANHPSATGSMRILDGGTVLTTLAVQLGGCANWYITPGLNAGTHTFTASYAGDNNYPAGTSAPATITVAKAPMTMEASCWNPSIPYGINYQCNANTDSGPKSGYMTYTYDNGAPVVLPLDSNGATAFIISTPSVGTHTVVIAYPTQGNYVGQTLPANTFTVRPAPVAVTLTPSAFSTTAGTQVSFTAKVTSGTTSVPNATGSVSFLNGSALLATVPVNASGLAVYSTSLNAGNNVITATYAGAANYGSGSATATIAVSQASQTITFTGLPATATYSAGLSYALTATASSSLPVSYVVTGPATTAGSILNITVAGTVTVTASQAGNTNYIAAKPVKLTISVGNPPLPSATISVQFASTTLVYPGATNITACVTAATKKAATGTVQILDGGNVLTTQTLQGNGCAYWSITPGLNAGSHVFTTSYSGDSKNAAGVSTPTTITVNPVPVTMSLSAAGGSTPYGVAFKRTVTVSSNAGSPLGSITYSLDGGTPISVALASGNALVNIALPSAGTHQVVIGYAQQTNYAAAASQTLSFTVTPAVSSVTLASSASSAKSGTNVSFTAAVTSTSAGAPNASGSVTFKDGSTVLATVAVNSTGNASYSITGLAVGLHTITATYAGSSNYATASTTTKVYITM